MDAIRRCVAAILECVVVQRPHRHRQVCPVARSDAHDGVTSQVVVATALPDGLRHNGARWVSWPVLACRVVPQGKRPIQRWRRAPPGARARPGLRCHHRRARAQRDSQQSNLSVPGHDRDRDFAGGDNACGGGQTFRKNRRAGLRRSRSDSDFRHTGRRPGGRRTSASVETPRPTTAEFVTTKATDSPSTDCRDPAPHRSTSPNTMSFRNG